MLPNLPTYEEIYSKFQWQIPDHFNIGSAVCEKYARQEPDRTALIGWRDQGEAIIHTYGELHDRSNRLANILLAAGLKVGERVAIILPQSLQAAISHIAIYKSGAVAVPLARLFAANALSFRLKHSGARFLITNSDGWRKISTIRVELPQLETVFVTGGLPDKDADIEAGIAEGFVVDFDQVIKNADGKFNPVNTRSQSPALIIYTSGTTGPPKGALHAHRVLLGHIPGLQVHHEFIPQPGDIAWTPADWAWAGGLLNILLPCLYMGVPVVYGGMERFDANRAFQLMAQTKTTCAFIPPTALRLMKTVDQPAKHHASKSGPSVRAVRALDNPLANGHAMNWALR